jgi:hypothetical protein
MADDCEKILVNDDEVIKVCKVNERDDLSGMVLNMSHRINKVGVFIIWAAYLFIHSEIFAIHILKNNFSNACNDDNTMTMEGTLISSVFMVLVVVLCILVF